MNLARLVLKNAVGSGLRSALVVLCVMVAAGSTVTATAVIRGAEASVRQGLSRFGADIVVVPEGSEHEVEPTLLLGTTSTRTFPSSTLAEIATVTGVDAVSPHLHLGNVRGLLPETQVSLVAFDPARDFTVMPWLPRPIASPLDLGEAICGSELASAGSGATLDLGGYPLRVMGILEATGTGLDRTLLFSFETAREMRESLRRLNPPIEFADDAYAAVFVRLRADADVRGVGPRIVQRVAGVMPVERPGMFHALQTQLTGLVQGALVVLVAIWGLSLLIVALTFSLSAGERRREIAVMRALGSTRRFVVSSLLLEAATLALLGGIAGAALATATVYVFGDAIAAGLGIPFLFPDPGSHFLLLGTGVALAALFGPLAALWPAVRATSEDPALAMRE